ncbi:MAG: response regulator [Methylococcaceae bacterium]|nr:response regulator [Methylococcaceae bacterium]
MTEPILIVDDEVANLAILRQILEADYSLVFARNGKEALAAVAKHHPSLILLDIQMPEMDGYEVCRQLKADPQYESIPVIFVTALSDLGNEEAGFNAGCVDYIVKPVVAPIVKARVNAHLSLVRATALEKSQRDAIFMLGEAGHYNDNDTGVHIWRMAAYSRELASAKGWSSHQCDLLELAAPMHDTGKIGISDSILQKPGPLSNDEWQIMKSHCDIGYRILMQSDAPLFKLAAQIALNHHEKWDGSGYPQGLSGLDIPEAARIVAIADVFDALTMKRPYKEAWTIDQAIANIQNNAGSHFDPELVKCFFAKLPRIIEIKNQWNQSEYQETKS